MHFEVLVEDRSGKRALDVFLSKMVSDPHTFRVIPYRGIGHVPKNLKSSSDARRRLLLDQLPRILSGYGRTHRGYQNYSAAVVVVCDLDDRCLKAFREELIAILSSCSQRPETRFCFAIEEGEAWLLGDRRAVEAAYPSADRSVLRRYRSDMICGTWELLADAVYRGGAAALKRAGWQAVMVRRGARSQRMPGNACVGWLA